MEVKSLFWEFPGNLVVNRTFNAEVTGSIPVWGTKILQNRMTQPQKKREREFAFDALSLRCPLGLCREFLESVGLLYGL